jgi:hypothetical protein
MAEFMKVLGTLDYVEVEQSTAGQSVRITKNATDNFLQVAEPMHPLRKAIRPIRQGVTIEDLIKESGFKKTNWQKVALHAHKMKITETTEELLAQLKA